ncbi:hypothetical protein FN846DRAFT_927751 [Sphaerosporella brunnea]|uniref:Uncharacterized protein n=1 Tax=Sphaerosporella brunnea TaxID=1250544 RepID=A0A5J5FAZ8_9PEZI|nr:hypothetical protein FN846DRAFT_927751 [Sphaerosporella brunnea]
MSAPASSSLRALHRFSRHNVPCRIPTPWVSVRIATMTPATPDSQPACMRRHHRQPHSQRLKYATSKHKRVNDASTNPTTMMATPCKKPQLPLRPRPAAPAPSVSTPAKPQSRLPSVYEYLTAFTPEGASISSKVHAGPNTRAEEYSWEDVAYPVRLWTEFTAAACTARFATELHERFVVAESVFVSPQKGGHRGKTVRTESGVGDFLTRTVSAQVNRALDASGLAILACAGADHKETADRVGVLETPGDGDLEMRVVGDHKVSWKWRSEWRDEKYRSHKDVEYRQVLSQVAFYMRRHGCRWGYVLTDREFVAIARDEARGVGALMVSEAVQWDSHGQPWGIALALWYLHAMAAADDEQWRMSPRQGVKVRPAPEKASEKKVAAVKNPAKKPAKPVKKAKAVVAEDKQPFPYRVG